MKFETMAKQLLKVHHGAEEHQHVVTDTNGAQWYTNGAVLVTTSENPRLPFTVKSATAIHRHAHKPNRHDYHYRPFDKLPTDMELITPDALPWRYLDVFKKSTMATLTVNVDGSIDVHDSDDDTTLHWHEYNIPTDRVRNFDARFLAILQPVSFCFVEDKLYGVADGITFLIVERRT